MRSWLSTLTYCAVSIPLVLIGLSCAPEKEPTPGPANKMSPAAVGTLTVDADISKGERFNVYVNDVWSAPERQQVVPGRRSKYTFPLPDSVRSLRFDPSEANGSQAVIYSITLDLPGMPKKILPLTDLPKFLKYHCDVKAEPNAVTISATGPEMYLMSTVAPASYAEAH